MVKKRVVMVVDMQNGVFATPRFRREATAERINLLTESADMTLYIQHTEAGGLEVGSEGFALIPEIKRRENAWFVTKTACDAFYRTTLDELLRAHNITHFVICGCATDYCVDTTLKNGTSRGYSITVAQDAHTTANRPAASAETLIAHYNDVWRDLIVPDNPVQVKSVETILQEWKAN